MGVVKRFRLSLEEYLNLPKMRRRDAENGGEIVSPVPIAPPIGWFRQPSMFDQVRDMVRSEHLRMYAEAQGDETFEEASDFEVEDELFPTSQYEDADDFEPLQDLQARRQAEFERNWRAEREKRRRAKEKREWDAEDAPPAPSNASSPASAGSPAARATPEGVRGAAPAKDQP